MIKSKFIPQQKGGVRMLLLGAHCDDIEIGCGGTVLKFIEEYKISEIKWIVFTSNEKRKKEAQTSAKQFLDNVAEAEVNILEYKDGYLPTVWSEVKNEFEKIKDNFSPDVIFTHYRHDLHQDHRVINELTWNTFRNHVILEYEIPKYDGDIGNPNLFVSISEPQKKQKNEIIMEAFKSQRNKHWLDDELLTSLMRFRGIECASASKYAEAFYTRKIIL